ncbi:MAG TPA: SMP-30/gluconolactonase/LRE family protein [Rhizomicrobium sp.]|nr:SMP-30/gluconolactonase/LRE family protein [Rhizomicrobium sp.]
MKLVDIIPARNTLGEGILWDAGRGSLWWTDIQQRKLQRHDLSKSKTETFQMPERLASFGFIEGTSDIIAAFETGIAFYNPQSANLNWQYRPTFEHPGIRFNDGRVDRQGRFWCGTMMESENGRSLGTLYRVDRAGDVSIHLRGVSISNGICCSPDSKTFYFADSPRRTIFAFDFDADNGSLSNQRVFVQTPEGAYPDGGNVDSLGGVWSAQWGAGRVVRYSPDGREDMVLEMPASQPTCVAFAGPKLDLLVVTSARDGLKPDTLMGQPHAGDVFIFKAPVAGLLDGSFIREEKTA